MELNDTEHEVLLQRAIENCPVKSDYDLAMVLCDALHKVMKNIDINQSELLVHEIIFITLITTMAANRKRGVVDYELNIDIAITTLNLQIKKQEKKDD